MTPIEKTMKINEISDQLMKNQWKINETTMKHLWTINEIHETSMKHRWTINEQSMKHVWTSMKINEQSMKHLWTSSASEYPHQKLYARFGIPPRRRGQSIRRPHLCAFCVGPQRTINIFQCFSEICLCLLAGNSSFNLADQFPPIFSPKDPIFVPVVSNFRFSSLNK